MYSQQKIKLSTNEKFDQVFFTAKLILNEYDLCDFCIGRLFAKKLGLASNKLLGKKIKKLLQKKSKTKCYICKDILSNLRVSIDKMLEISSDYQFTTFLVGAILKPSITDRDDNIRSRFRLQGIDSVKTDITHQIAKIFAKKTKSKIDYLKPDLTFTINFKKDFYELFSRPLILCGRYTKDVRGLSQKQKSCKNCNGKGCFSCKYHGISDFDSIEGRISKFLFEKFGGTLAKITWIGGEDKKSLVFGNGRPFFVKLLNPKIRKTRLNKKYRRNEVVLKDLKIIEQIPKNPLSFISNLEITIQTAKKIKSTDLMLLKKLKKSPILVHEGTYKKNQKFIYDLKYKKNSTNTFSLWIEADGGLPIKRFVEGTNVTPNLSELLKNNCKCKQFDFHNIEITS